MDDRKPIAYLSKTHVGVQPGAALALAAAGYMSALVLAGVLSAVTLVVTDDLEAPLTIAAGFIGLWIPMVGACVVAGRRFGTGSLGDALGFRFQPLDLPLAVVIAIGGVMASFAVQLLLSPFPELVGSNTGIIEEQRGSAFGVVVIAVSTLVGAPLVEELFFRGLVLRGLFPKLAWAAALVQALVFGLIHFDPTLGVGNIGVVLGVGAFGLVQGVAALRIGRIGPVILSHALFNALAVVPLLLGH